jgi:hypothetical protein
MADACGWWNVFACGSRTLIYTHVLNRGILAVRSPLD